MYIEADGSQRVQGRRPGLAGVVPIGVWSRSRRRGQPPAGRRRPEGGWAAFTAPHTDEISWKLRLVLYSVARRAGLGPEERSGGCL